MYLTNLLRAKTLTQDWRICSDNPRFDSIGWKNNSVNKHFQGYGNDYVELVLYPELFISWLIRVRRCKQVVSNLFHKGWGTIPWFGGVYTIWYLIRKGYDSLKYIQALSTPFDLFSILQSSLNYFQFLQRALNWSKVLSIFQHNMRLKWFGEKVRWKKLNFSLTPCCTLLLDN